MKNLILMTILLVNIPLSASHAESTTVNNLLQDYAILGAGTADAEQGSFNEHDVRIPGYGRWDD